ncbi:uncharacterized protein FPRO_12527 [Fusarium proliferatum ET1]|uniref:Uncharacterized protein n=1 Tax=Fusarium proliferatum (strain ET1) TaxID=1227346 RepID=A0A1L7W914_FUSPR|nr:uncharacterized protein FPRO_12527 [Fusarium proliferatum ET1]CZR49090.1 uncharacterized protein FPRO_12527 [Fusarium proliferatum ET1]
MNRLHPSCNCEAELTRLKERVTLLEKQLADILPQKSSDKVAPKKKRKLNEATISTDAEPPKKKAPKRSETGVLASKASLLTCMSEARDDPKLDRRYLTQRGPPITKRAFSKAYLEWTLDDMDPRVTPFRYRHRKANECPAQESCKHWHIVDGIECHKEGDIYMLLNCLDTESVEEGDSGCEGINMFDDEEPRANRITLHPCRIFNSLKPDFSAIEDESNVVLHCLVLDYGKTVEEDGDHWKWMDQYGRLISRMSL